MPEKKKTKNFVISRRDFTRQTALAAATVACLPGELLARPLRTLPPPPQETEKKPSPETQAEADAKMEALLRKYGARLSEAQKKDLNRLVIEGQKPLEAMRAFSLDNSDQPGNVLKLYPDPSAPRRARSR
jgi:hypothetical protein